MGVRTENVQAIIFDLDRTLIISQNGFDKSLKTATEALVEYLRKHGELKSKNEVYRRLRPIANSFEKHRLYNRDDWWTILLEKLGLSHLQGRWIHQLTLVYWRAYLSASPPYHDAEKTVRTLHQRGYRLALVSDTDGTPGMKRRRVRALPFYDLFEAAVVAGEDTERIKPDKTSFILIARKLGISPRQCVYIGDNPTVDVTGARESGMQTIIIKRRSNLKGARPDLTIDRLSKLIGIF